MNKTSSWESNTARIIYESLNKASSLTKRIHRDSSKINVTELVRILDDAKVASIATVKDSGTPHVVPVSFIYYQGIIYVNSNRKSIRFRNHIRNNRVALTIIGNYGIVIMEGKAEVAGKTEELVKGKVANAFLKKYKRPRRISEDSFIICITPTKILTHKIGTDNKKS